MDIRTEKRGDVRIFDIEGAVHLEYIHKIREAFKKSLEAGDRKVIVRMASTEAISSGGVGALLNHHQELQKNGGRLVLAELSQQCSYVLGLLRLVDFFEIADSMNEALALLAEQG